MPAWMPVTDALVRYRHIAHLGAGGMATVTLAEDTTLGRRVALKRVHASGDARAILRLRREALVGASLSHPNLVSIYDVEIGDGRDLVIVMEYVAGETLRDAIAASGGGLEPAFALDVLGGVAAALDAIHARGIVHRDVKPANILLGRDGAVKLADLGIAMAADRTQITSPGVILGTFGYMAPEQLDGATATPAADVYALAAVAFEMLSGQKVRPQPNPLAVARASATRPPPDLCAVSPQAPRAAAAVLGRGLAADPARRPRSAGELVDRLRAALAPAGDTRPAPWPAVPAAPALAPAAAMSPPRRVAAAVSASGRRGGTTIGGWEPAARAQVPRGKPLLIVAGVGAFALAVLALALGGSGGKQAGHAAASGSARAPAASTGASAPGAGAAAPLPVSPSGAVEAFYGHASRHDYAGAWALADPAFRAQLAGYDSFAAQQSQVRRITFDRVATSYHGRASAMVAIQTTAELTSTTQHCQGPVEVVRAPTGGWLLHQISINCA